MIAPFSVARLPRIEFGAGARHKLPALAATFGKRLLLVTGARSFTESPHGAPLLERLRAQGCQLQIVRVSGEPSPELVDDAVRAWRGARIDAVLGIGGGSVLDAAKAIAGLLVPANSVLDHLEGVGPEAPYHGPATPFIALPTTAGTGSEATKNAVLSRPGPSGFKKSFRDDALVAQLAIVDPDLLAGCPPALIAANGMDALTQLLEAYVSTRANAFTDPLARAGLRAARDGLLAWHAGGDGAAEARERMAFASLASGICLAQAGLGSVHGLASPLGAFFPIAHGVACGTLVAAATRVNIEALEARAPDHPALGRYAEVARLLGMPLKERRAAPEFLDPHGGRAGLGPGPGGPLKERRAAPEFLDPHGGRAGLGPGPGGPREHSPQEERRGLVHLLERWTVQLELPTLGALGVTAADVPRIVAASRGSSMKTNPVVLSDDEIARVIVARLDQRRDSAPNQASSGAL